MGHAWCDTRDPQTHIGQLRTQRDDARVLVDLEIILFRVRVDLFQGVLDDGVFANVVVRGRHSLHLGADLSVLGDDVLVTLKHAGSDVCWVADES